MRRRQFLIAIGGAAVGWSRTVRAQQSVMPVIGFVNNGTAEANSYLSESFRHGMSETGYIDRQNVAIEYHWADYHDDRLPRILADLVRRRVSVIAATSTQAALAAKNTTGTIPIVFETGGDPIKLGLVESLSRPGGNVTGITQLTAELMAKRLGLLHDLVPKATMVGFLVTPTDPLTGPQTKDLQDATLALGLQMHVLNVSTRNRRRGD